MSEKKIIQIIPAGDWVAEYEVEEKTNVRVPLACFAVIEHENSLREVQGMDSGNNGIEFCEESENFLRYIKVVD